MPKRLESNKTVALNYYIGANLIAFIPAIIVGIIIGKISTSAWQYILYEIILFVPVIYFAFKWSAKNINRGFVVTDRQSIANWSIGYLLFFSVIVITLSFIRFRYVSVSAIASLLNTIGAGIIIYIFTPKFLLETPAEEIDQIKSEANLDPKKSGTGKRILKTAGITLLMGIVVIAIFFMYIIYSQH